MKNKRFFCIPCKALNKKIKKTIAKIPIEMSKIHYFLFATPRSKILYLAYNRRFPRSIPNINSIINIDQLFANQCQISASRKNSCWQITQCPGWSKLWGTRPGDIVLGGQNCGRQHQTTMSRVVKTMVDKTRR